jgi:RND family efflux transporter MFP subunit
MKSIARCRTNPFLICLTMLAMCLTSCGRRSDVESTTQPPRIPVTRALVTNVPADRSFVGNIQNTNHIEIRSRVKGFIEQVAVDEGQRVARGQLLFSVSRQEFETEVLLAEAKLKGTEATLAMERIGYENARLLLDKRIIPPNELELCRTKVDAASAAVAEARASLDGARRRLEWAEVRAPFDGVVGRLNKRAGSMVDEADVLAPFSSEGDVFVYFAISESDSSNLAQGWHGAGINRLSLQLANGVDYPKPGVLEGMSSMVDRSTGTFTLRGRFANPDRTLRHGASVRVTVHETLTNMLVIPQKCTFEVQHKLCVLRVDEQQTVRIQPIVPARRLAAHFVVKDGLTEKDRIVLEGLQSLREGDVIEPDVRRWELEHRL